MRLPDLWLKHKLALAVAPADVDLAVLTNTEWARCLKPDGGGDLFNKCLAGDRLCHTQGELFYLAAAHELLVLHGALPTGRPSVVDYLERTNEQITLYPEPIKGTFGDYAKALLALLARRDDWRGEKALIELMTRTINRHLVDRLVEVTDAAGPLRLLPSGEERIFRKPHPARYEFKRQERARVVVPAASRKQCVFGFELSADNCVVPWEAAGRWFEPCLQSEGEPLTLADSEVDGAGTYRFLIIAIDAEHQTEPELPVKLAQLTPKTPESWPDGYACAMASITYASRLHENRVKAENARLRNKQSLAPHPDDEAPLPARARLYRAEYAVTPA